MFCRHFYTAWVSQPVLFWAFFLTQGLERRKKNFQMPVQCLPTDLAKRVLPSRCTAWMPQWPSAFGKFSLNAHIHTQKSNLIIKIFRDTLFRDTHVASRNTLLNLRELTLDKKRCCGFPSPLLPANLFRFWGFHFLFIALLLASQKVFVIPPDFIPFYLANVDSPPSSYVSHMKLLQPLLWKHKKKNCVPLSYPKIS